jgi:ferritin-like protein
MSSETLHGADVIDNHRAIVSLMEELEAVDWYNQRAKATRNQELRAILEHNRDEEKEHAAMALEWIRRNDPKMHQHLKTYLFTEGPLTALEAQAKGDGSDGNGDDAEGAAPAKDGSLGIGSLRKAGGQDQ